MYTNVNDSKAYRYLTITRNLSVDVFHCVLVTNLHKTFLTHVTARTLNSRGIRVILYEGVVVLIQNLKTSRGNEEQNYNQY